ncbi:MAG: peptidoglycan endopeptidase [Sphingobium sp.]
MADGGARVRDAALRLVGVPFRLHGRSVETGVDCVGLALLSLRGAGFAVPDPPPYRMRTGSLPVSPGWLRSAGLVEGRGRRPGDLSIVQVSPIQIHLMIDAGDGAVHAHAGLGRVVRAPWPGNWPELARWRPASPQ